MPLYALEFELAIETPSFLGWSRLTVEQVEDTNHLFQEVEAYVTINRNRVEDVPFLSSALKLSLPFRVNQI